VVDEGVQIHGGNGYSDEYIISKAYRDSRINRIYEGTNEINRLLTVDMVLKRAMKGRLDIMGPAMAVSKELMSIPEFGSDGDTPFAKEKKTIQNFKKAILMTAGAAVQKLMMKLESAAACELDIMRTWLYDAADRINKSGKDAINAFADGDEQRMMLLGLKRFTKVDPFNSKAARRRIADKLINDNKYPL
jgi:hypothetical protein